MINLKQSDRALPSYTITLVNLPSLELPWYQSTVWIMAIQCCCTGIFLNIKYYVLNHHLIVCCAQKCEIVDPYWDMPKQNIFKTNCFYSLKQNYELMDVEINILYFPTTEYKKGIRSFVSMDLLTMSNYLV